MGLYAKTTFSLLCEQIQRDNPGMDEIRPDNYSLVGYPPTLTGERNTELTLAGIPGKGLSGSITVKLDRLYLNDLFRELPTLTFKPGSFTAEERVAELDVQLGLGLKKGDIYDITEFDKINPKLDNADGYLSISSYCPVFYTNPAVTYRYKAKASGVIYPNSGPGEKRLTFGDTKCGVFGFVTPEEFIGGSEYLKLFCDNQISLYKEDPKWLKCFLDDRVLYIATDGVAYTTYAEVYKYGGICGVDGTGTWNPGTPVNQLKILPMTKDGKTYQFQTMVPSLTVENRIGKHLTKGHGGDLAWIHNAMTYLNAKFLTRDDHWAGRDKYVVGYWGSNEYQFNEQGWKDSTSACYYPVLYLMEPKANVPK